MTSPPPLPSPIEGEEVGEESFFFGKGRNFNELRLPYSGFQKVTRLYPIDLSSGSQLIKNIKQLRVENHFHFFSEHFCISEYEILKRKEGGRGGVGGERS
jgi:hypothetical protein